MVTIRNVDVGFMRVQAASGASLGNDHDILEEIRASLRNGRDDPTVVQAIQSENRRLLAAIDGLSRQMSGVPGGGAPSGGGGAGGGAGGGGARTGREPDELYQNIFTILEKLERAVAAFEGGGGGGEGIGGPGGSMYFQREVALSRFGLAKQILDQLIQNELALSDTVKGIVGLFKDQMRAAGEGFISSLLGMGLHMANVGTAFRQFHHDLNQQVVAMREGGVFGSNVLSPAQFFLEGLTRVREGILTTSDSFRTMVNLVGDSLQHNLMSPLLTTGRAASELVTDFHEARQDLRQQFGVDTRAFMSTREANAHLSSLVELNMRYGIQSTVRDIRTELMMAQDQQYLRTIASMTGETVGKLSEQLRNQRQQNEMLMGLGSLRNPTEAANFSSSTIALQKIAGGGTVAETVTRMLMGGREPGSIIAAMPEFATMAASMPQMFNSMLQLQDAMLKKASPDQLYAILARWSRSGEIQAFQGMPQVMRQDIFGSMLPQITAMINAAQAAASRPTADQEQRRRAAEDPIFRTIQRFTEIWQENIAPFMTLERAMVGLTAAVLANTTALLFTAGRGGFGGMLGMAGRVLGPVAGGAIAGGMAYAGGSSMEGVTGAAGGSLIGGILGGFAGPIGSMIGMAAGGVIGNYIGSRFAGPESGIGFGASASSDMMGQVVTTNNETNSILDRIHGELQRQTGYLQGGSGSPEAGRPAGSGLHSGSLPSRSMLNRPDDSTPYVGP